MREALPIFLNNNQGEEIIGYVVLDESISDNDLMKCALTPVLVRTGISGFFKSRSFLLTDRTLVDTSPRDLS